MLYKYPRTPHLAYSPGKTSDDKVIESLDSFKGQRVIVTIKMDGENSSLYADHIHARSLDSRHHPSRDWLKGFWGSIKHNIPEGWRVCGENLYAKHSIHYDALPSYFMGFSVWNENNICLSWDETLTFFDSIGIIPVPMIYDGMFDEEKIRALIFIPEMRVNEGFVVRNAGRFSYADFAKNVVKYVRKDHVTSSSHWSTEKITPNKLK